MNNILLGFVGGIVTGISTIIGGTIILSKNNKIETFVKKIDSDFIVGVMIVASAFSLILPAYDDFNVSLSTLSLSVTGGISFILVIQKILKYINKTSISNEKLLFLIGILAHNFPEGLASGSSFQLNDYSVLSAISIQNIPEGFITTLSLMSIGLSPQLAFIGNVLTGLIEVLGGIVGGYIGSVNSQSLPLIMAFAGGSMMYVSIVELMNRIKEYSFRAILNPSFISGGILMYALTLI